MANGTISNFRVLGGRTNFASLTLTKLRISEKQYKIEKAYAWLALLKDRMYPKKWHKPTRNGTKVDFDVIPDREMFHRAKGEFKGYIAALNEEYPELELEFVEATNE